MDAAVGGELVLSGGATASGLLADTWTWNGTVWTQENVTGPAARYWSTMATQ